MDIRLLMDIIRREADDIRLFLGSDADGHVLSDLEIALLRSKIQQLDQELELLKRLRQIPASGSEEGVRNSIPEIDRSPDLVQGIKSAGSPFEAPPIPPKSPLSHVHEGMELNAIPLDQKRREPLSLAPEPKSLIGKMEPEKGNSDERVLETLENFQPDILPEYSASPGSEFFEKPGISDKPKNEPKTSLLEPVNPNPPAQAGVEVKTVAKEAEKEIVLPRKTKTPAGKSSSVADQFASESPSVNDRLSGKKKDQDLAGKLSHSKIADVRSAISLNEKLLFTRDLFHGDTQAYNILLDEINNQSDLAAAEQLVKQKLAGSSKPETLELLLELVSRRF